MNRKKVMNDDEWNKNFITGIFINKLRTIKCINIILTKEEEIFDEVCMIATYNTYDDGYSERCAMNEVVLSMEFPGYPEEIAYLTYKEFFKLIEYGVEQRISRFNVLEREEILKELDKARKVISNLD